MAELKITDENYEEIIAANKVVLIDFWATWCAPCRRLAPIVAQIADEYEGKAAVGKYNVENNDVLSSYRALSLFNYLTQNTSIDPAAIKHSGRGEYAPIADNSTPEGRSKNRRIEIKVYNSLNSLVR